MSGPVRYVRWPGIGPLPALEDVRAYKVLVVIETPIAPAERARLADLLAEAGPASVSTWGPDCEDLHDDIDHADMARHGFPDYSDPRTPIIMTTWHSKESLKSAMWFVKNSTDYNDRDDNEALLLHVSRHDAQVELMAEYHAVNEDDDKESQ